MRLTKAYAVQLKALDGEPGTFSALVSVFGNVDLQGDRVMPTAFDASIERWKASGDPIPVVFSHDWQDPFSHVGYVDPNDLEVTKAGLVVKKGVLDIADNPVAAQIYRLMKRRSLKEWSFAYEVNDEAPGKDGANELKAIDIIEVGMTLKGANPATETLGVKSAVELARMLHEDQEIAEFKRTIDTLLKDDGEKWDGAAAMASCSDAADFGKIAFERDNDSDPDTAAHWALPHHGSPGADADPDGVSAALGALNGARGGAPALKDEGAARSHLESHQASFDSDEDADEKADEPETKFYEPLAGSDEERRDAICEAVSAWARSAYPPNPDGYGPWAWVVGTFPDHVVVEVEMTDADDLYFEVPYTVEDDGTVTLGTPAPVEITVQVRGKATREPVGEKAGRVLSAKTESKLATAAEAIAKASEAVNDVLAAVRKEPTDDAAPEKSEAVRADEDLRSKIELLAAEL